MESQNPDTERYIEMMHDIGLSLIANQFLSTKSLEIQTLLVDGDENIEVKIGLDTLMKVYARDAQEAVKEHWGVELDLTPESLHRLDEIILKQYETIPKGIMAKLRKQVPDDSIIEENARLWSGYAGEVMHRNSAVTWGLAVDHNSGNMHIALIAGELLVPIVMNTAERIRTGFGERFGDTYTAVRKAAPFPETD